MKKLAFSLVFLVAVAGCRNQQPTTTTPSNTATTAPVSGPFTASELQKFDALDPIDTHTHIHVSEPAVYAFLKTYNLHVLDIMIDSDLNPVERNLAVESKDAWNIVHQSDGRIAFCTTFNPYPFRQPDFAKVSIQKINSDFAKGAVAVKLWKNVGMEIKDAKGNYLMPDNLVFEPIFKDIEAHDKTLIIHVADPNSAWEAPNPASPDYDWYTHHPKLYMYGKPGVPSKAAILAARDRILDRNPKLRIVGAHLGSMESNFDQLAQRLDKYPNFAVDIAARMPYIEMQPRAKMIAFFTKYQDRLIYGTDHEIAPGDNVQEALKEWQDDYANDWRYLATGDTILYGNQKVRGLDLPPSILRKIYHDNAVHWFPGILKDGSTGKGQP
jgi:predicted TIM-barrel fold metal-dependent hydrolase